MRSTLSAYDASLTRHDLGRYAILFLAVRLYVADALYSLQKHKRQHVTRCGADVSRDWTQVEVAAC